MLGAEECVAPRATFGPGMGATRQYNSRCDYVETTQQIRERSCMYRAFIGQAIGVVCIPLWIGAVVYFMSRAATPNASDAGNWFVGFVVLTVVFIAIMTFWGRFFRQE